MLIDPFVKEIMFPLVNYNALYIFTQDVGRTDTEHFSSRESKSLSTDASSMVYKKEKGLYNGPTDWWTGA